VVDSEVEYRRTSAVPLLPARLRPQTTLGKRIARCWQAWSAGTYAAWIAQRARTQQIRSCVGATSASTLLTGRGAWEEGHSMRRGDADVEAVLASLIGGAK